MNNNSGEGYLYADAFNDNPLELVLPPTKYKGSSTKSGGNFKEIAKRHKRNKNKKTHRNAKR